MKIHNLSQFMVYIRNISFVGIIRLAVLICLLSLFFGHNSLTLDSDRAGLPFLLRAMTGLLYYAAKYLTFPLTIVGVLAIIGNKYNCKIFIIQTTSLSMLWCFVIYMIIQIYFTPYVSITEARLEVLYTYVLPIAVAIVLFAKPSDVLLVRNSFYLVGILVVIMFLLSGAQGLFVPILTSLATNEMDRLVLTSDTITSANHSLISALSGLCILANTKFKTKINICIIVSIVLLITMALGTGSKGPIVSFAVTIFVMVLLVNISLRLKLLFIVFLVLTITIEYMIINTILPASIEHLTTKDATRTNMYLTVIHSEPTLLGEGVGAFSERFGGFGDNLTYMHNIFLESYFETGIVGLLLLLVLIGNLLLRMLKLYKHTNDPALLFCATGFIYHIVLGQFSGYLLGNNGIVMFFMMGTWLAALPQDMYALPNM